jgi:DNA integrity scanning protein DisA with diadenylate cyclase activity
MSNDRIKQLQNEIESEKRKIQNCKHIFDKAFYNPETIKEPYGYEMKAQGSDVYYEPKGYKDVKKDRWTRKCTICGNEEHTDKQKPIINGYEPSF